MPHNLLINWIVHREQQPTQEIVVCSHCQLLFYCSEELISSQSCNVSAASKMSALWQHGTLESPTCKEIACSVCQASLWRSGSNVRTTSMGNDWRLNYRMVVVVRNMLQLQMDQESWAAPPQTDLTDEKFVLWALEHCWYKLIINHLFFYLPTDVWLFELDPVGR